MLCFMLLGSLQSKRKRYIYLYISSSSSLFFILAMVLKYFSHLPLELREKIVKDHLKKERKEQFLREIINEKCAYWSVKIIEGNFNQELVVGLSEFLTGLCSYVGEQQGKKCYTRWSKDVNMNIKLPVIEEQHLKFFGYEGHDILSCGELLFMEEDEDEDIVYEEGYLLDCRRLEDLLSDLSIGYCYIVIDKEGIRIPEL
uniref:Cell cycle link protein n=1 Tax=Parsley severe stunt associated virus TaxID=2558055 RepID=A0A6G7BNK8_9VIRU|nr:cell cycle link protein [Parsley severe stunt associated virus]